ncbi:hypothetical protein BN1088_990007 [Sphingobacterium sp. PM2-P1-29]|nr:hypothetical protein BN1088_990007 [Sphingobacterium sp. PM2-P1-29]
MFYFFNIFDTTSYSQALLLVIPLFDLTKISSHSRAFELSII